MPERTRRCSNRFQRFDWALIDERLHLEIRDRKELEALALLYLMGSSSWDAFSRPSTDVNHDANIAHRPSDRAMGRAEGVLPRAYQIWTTATAFKASPVFGLQTLHWFRKRLHTYSGVQARAAHFGISSLTHPERIPLSPSAHPKKSPLVRPLRICLIDLGITCSASRSTYSELAS